MQDEGGARAERVQRRLEPVMFVAALATIPAIYLESGAAGDEGQDVAFVLNWIIWLLFLGEAVLMLSLVADRLQWLRRHPLEVLIVVLTPPFLPAAFGALRLVRALRLLRVVRAVVSLKRLLSLEGLKYAGLLTLALVLLGGVAFARVEEEQGLSAWDGVWWAVTTVTTVGYGDISPQTDSGRLLAMGIMIVGIGFVAMITAAAAEYFVNAKLERQQEETTNAELMAELRSLRDRIDELEEGLRGR